MTQVRYAFLYPLRPFQDGHRCNPVSVVAPPVHEVYFLHVISDIWTTLHKDVIAVLVMQNDCRESRTTTA